VSIHLGTPYAAVFSNRSQAIQVAVEEKMARLEQNRLARECAKLDPAFEKALAREMPFLLHLNR
jgi:hypothetical protein